MIFAQQVRRPLVGIALSVAAGIEAQHCTGGSPLIFLSAAAFLLAFIAWNPLRSRTAVLFYFVCGLLAAAYGAIAEAPSCSRAPLRMAEVNSSEQELIGTIRDEPAVSGADGTRSFLFRAETVLYSGESHPVDDTLKVYLRDPAAEVRFGETWRLRGRVTLYEKPRGGASGFLSVPAACSIRLHAAEPSLMSRCYDARRRAAEILRSGIDAFPDQIKLLHALLLGYRQAMPPELYRMFSRTGILHIFAISGLHVGVMAAIMIAVLKLVGVPRPHWGWLLIPALFFYVLSTGMKASALRAFTMAAVYFAAPLVGRRPDAPSSVALAAILLLAINPANIGDPGFLLSFLVVCGILMMHGWLARQVNGLRFSGWDGPLKQLNGPHPAAALIRATGLLLITSLAAWLFSAPITARFFHTLSPVALIGNLAVIPLTFMIMLTGCLAILSGALFLPAAVLFNFANVQFISLLIWIVRRLSALPGAGLSVHSPSGWVSVFWFAGLTFFFTGPVRWRKAAGLLILLSGLLWSTEYRGVARSIKVLRAGDSALAIRLPERNRWILVTDDSEFSAARALRLLQSEGVNRLDTLVVRAGSGASESVRQFQEIFRPQQTLYGDEAYWETGAGIIRISRNR